VATAQEILNKEYDLLYAVLPTYIYSRDWSRVTLYFRDRLERIRKNIEAYEKKVEDVEERTAALMARVVELENA